MLMLPLGKEGIDCYRFAKLSPVLKSSYNNRDHRKICVIDGRVAYTGGINISDEYINLINRFGYWKDGGIRIEGIAARGFARLFLSLYDMTRGKISDYSRYFDKSVPNECDFSENKGYFIPFGSGPLPAYSEPVGKNAIINIVGMAERYLYITTPYLIIDYDLAESLRNTAIRGVDVRIITPAVADKKLIKVMTKSSYPYLVEAGVKIYEYSPGFIHEKTVVCDDLYAMVGTVNLDYRSLAHHYEDAIWIYSSPTVLTVKEKFEKTLTISNKIAEKSTRLGVFEWCISNLIRIFAQLL